MDVYGEPLEANPAECRPVFVVGMNGSGTSMLADCLGRHSGLYAGTKETRVIPYLIARASQFGDLGDDKHFLELWRTVTTILALQRMNGSRPVPIPENWREFPRNVASVVDGVFRQLARRHGKNRWGEKTPQNVQHMPVLHGAFPGARFIHIIRDGRDCAASFHRRWLKTPELTMYRWKHVVRAGRRDGAALGDRCMEVRYEDLTAAPEQWMRSICEFLGLPFESAVLYSGRPQNANQSGLPRIERNSERWRSYFTKRELERLERIGGVVLQEQGYPVEFAPGDKDPSQFYLKCWDARDNTRQLVDSVLHGRPGRTRIEALSDIGRWLKAAYKQRQLNRY